MPVARHAVRHHTGQQRLDARSINVDIRVLSATNIDLETSLAQLRRDLFYRLASVTLRLPPLRDRQSDIPILVDYYIKQFSKSWLIEPPHLSVSVLGALCNHDWPGNIRELKNIVERAIIISPADAIKPENLHIHSPNKPIVIIKEKDFGENSKNSLPPLPDFPINLKHELEKIEYTYMTQAYEVFGNVRDAAKNLGLTPSTFVRKRKQYQQKNTESERT